MLTSRERRHGRGGLHMHGAQSCSSWTGACCSGPWAASGATANKISNASESQSCIGIATMRCSRDLSSSSPPTYAVELDSRNTADGWARSLLDVLVHQLAACSDKGGASRQPTPPLMANEALQGAGFSAPLHMRSRTWRLHDPSPVGRRVVRVAPGIQRIIALLESAV